MTFLHIPAGRFAMGSETGQDDERPVHDVEVDAFECAVFPVTIEEYAVFLEETGHETLQVGPPVLQGGRSFSRKNAGLEEQAGLPVTSVSWFDSVAFCAWHTSRGNPMRLPTEAQWEYAARGGLVGTDYPWPCDVFPAWIPNGGRGPLQGPWPVDLGEPNGFGLYGISANIHEWCADWHSADYYAVSPVRNPTGPPSGTRRASRGGAWRHALTISRCAQRSKIDPSFRYSDYGFRPVRS